MTVFACMSKPSSVEFYMTDFIQEVNSLQSNGVLNNDRHIDFSMGAFICDAPANLAILAITRVNDVLLRDHGKIELYSMRTRITQVVMLLTLTTRYIKIIE